ncbi:MAG: hypothetical protein LBN12_07525, partial [Clostridiales Family XIII bacterium]|nr:hypothetical protein [Clostridiales Family XIII bacterium]
GAKRHPHGDRKRWRYQTRHQILKSPITGKRRRSGNSRDIVYGISNGDDRGVVTVFRGFGLFARGGGFFCGSRVGARDDIVTFARDDRVVGARYDRVAFARDDRIVCGFDDQIIRIPPPLSDSANAIVGTSVITTISTVSTTAIIILPRNNFSLLFKTVPPFESL